MNLDNLTDISRRDVLGALGLAPRVRDYIWPALGLFSTGVLLGAGVALMLAPKSGAKLRAEIRDEVRTKLDELERKFGGKKSKHEDDDTDDAEQQQQQQQAQAA